MMLLCFHNSIAGPTVTMTESPASTTTLNGTVDLASSSTLKNLNPTPSQTEISTSSTNHSLSSSIFAGIAVAGMITVVLIIMVVIIVVIFVYRRRLRKHYLEKDSTPSHWL